MDDKISVVIYNTLADIIDTYPILADVEDSKKLSLPYAVYRVKAGGDRTKETIKRKYDVCVFVVCKTFGRSEEITSRIESAVGLLNGLYYCVSAVEYEVKYDSDDRCYVCEILFTIKKL